MPKVTHASKDHRHAMLIGRGNDLIITHGSAGLNHAAYARLCRVINTITEREERVRGHHCALYFEPGVLSFNAGNARRIDAAHLTSADTDGAVVFGINNGVLLDHFGDFPGEQHVSHFIAAGYPITDDLKVFLCNHAVVALLN